jgi:hypothetical protein
MLQEVADGVAGCQAGCRLDNTLNVRQNNRTP